VALNSLPKFYDTFAFDVEKKNKFQPARHPPLSIFANLYFERISINMNYKFLSFDDSAQFGNRTKTGAATVVSS
jgi:hypothetical protein